MLDALVYLVLLIWTALLLVVPAEIAYRWAEKNNRLPVFTQEEKEEKEEK